MAALRGDEIVDVSLDGGDRGAEDRAARLVRSRQGLLRLARSSHDRGLSPDTSGRAADGSREPWLGTVPGHGRGRTWRCRRGPMCRGTVPGHVPGWTWPRRATTRAAEDHGHLAASPAPRSRRAAGGRTGTRAPDPGLRRPGVKSSGPAGRPALSRVDRELRALGLGVPLPAAAVEEQRARTGRGQQLLAPVADEQLDVRRARPGARAGRVRARSRVELDGDERARASPRSPQPRRRPRCRPPRTTRPAASTRSELPDLRQRPRAAGHVSSSTSGNDRCRARRDEEVLAVRRLEHGVEALPAVARARTAAASRPGSTPSIASRLRWKSSLVGLKTTKCTPAAGSRELLVAQRVRAPEERVVERVEVRAVRDRGALRVHGAVGADEVALRAARPSGSRRCGPIVPLRRKSRARPRVEATSAGGCGDRLRALRHLLARAGTPSRRARAKSKLRYQSARSSVMCERCMCVPCAEVAAAGPRSRASRGSRSAAARAPPSASR